jgi:hypothetical protein
MPLRTATATATVASGAYRRAIQAVRPEAEVLEIACPLFVPSIEAGILDGAELRAAAKAHLEPLLAARVEAIVLGCTHYPMLRPMLKELVPVGIRLLDPAAAVARRLAAGTYFIVVDGDASATSGDFDLAVVTTMPSTPPANDTCTAPETVTLTNGMATRTVDLTAANADIDSDLCGSSATKLCQQLLQQATQRSKILCRRRRR